MTHTSKHTFAVLAYQRSPYIEACINSLKQQTVKSKVIIATSTPSPFLEKIAKKYAIPLMINPERMGIAADWTFAYNNCQTDYVTLAHQDDHYLPGYTKTCLEAAAIYPGSLIIFTDYMELFQKKIRDNTLLLKIKRLLLSIFYVSKISLSSHLGKRMMFLLGNPICCPSILYNRKNIGDFTFDSSFTMNLDWEASLRLSENNGDFIYVNKKLLIRRIHDASESTNALMTNIRQEEDRMLFERFWPKPVLNIILKLYTLAYRSNG